MNRKGEISLGEIVILFVGIIVAIALINPIFSAQNQMTDKQVVTDEAIDISAARLAGGTINTTYPFTVTNNPTGWKTTGCPLTSVVYGNSTDDYTVTTDYVITASTGVLTLKNTVVVNNSASNDTLIDYTWCADGYNTGSGARGMARLIGIFTVFALLGFVMTGLKNDWFN